MRKFNLKDNAVKRIKSLEKIDVPDCTESAEQADSKNENAGLFVVSRTDTGLVRKNNQDSVIIGNRLFGVADGMGGHNAGEIASGRLRDELIREIADQKPDSEILEKAIQKVNLVIFNQQEKDASLTGMGTTLTVMWASDEEMIIAQVGDSRAYRIRAGQIMQITQDHSMVADMVRSGVLTEEQAACHPMRNYITRAIGTDEEVEVDIYREKREAGDRWLICSDGLYGLMSKSTLESLASVEDSESAADQLLQKALENGGRDNISLVLITDKAGSTVQEQTIENTIEQTHHAEPLSDQEGADA